MGEEEQEEAELLLLRETNQKPKRMIRETNHVVRRWLSKNNGPTPDIRPLRTELLTKIITAFFTDSGQLLSVALRQ